MNFYFGAAKTLDRLDAKQGSIKGVLATLPEKDRKRTAALVIETLKYKSVLSDVIVLAKLLKEEKKITSMNLALVLVHDLLLAGGIQAGDGPIKQGVLRHRARLNGELQKIKIKRGARSSSELAQLGDERAVRIPRYVRVNTAVWTTEDAVKWYISRGFQLTGPFESDKGFSKDEHIPNLLLFSPQTQFHDDSAYKAGKIILQDKASCFPAVVLAPPSEDSSVVLDATAAPGNKTSHISALMHNKGKVFAFERDRKRFSTLKMMLSKAHCRNVECLNVDFLAVNPLDPQFSMLTHILLDPSCSGSGIVNRLDYLVDTEEEENDSAQEERLNKLAAFQLMMVKHAMKSVIKIVYSTCSIHATENEQVVRQALESEEARAAHFVLAPRSDVLPAWKRRGLTEEMSNAGDASSLVRCSPGDDATNGFFVSCFVKGDLKMTGGMVKEGKRKADEATEGEVAERSTTGTGSRKRKKMSNKAKRT